MKTLRRITRKTRKNLVIATLVGAFIGLTAFGSKDFEIAKNLDIFSSLFKELVTQYVDDVNPSEVIKTGIDEMLYSLDPYTTFIPESEIEDVRFMTTGQYGGIGAVIRARGDYIVIAEPYQDAPAYKAGLKAGDVIKEVNGRSVKDLNADDVRNLLQGQPGTTVSVKVEREGEEQLLGKTIERDVVKIDNIPYYGMVNETTGYIKLTGFTQNAGREVRNAFNRLREEQQVESLILDLRDNGGGLMNEAVNITNIFIDRDQLVVSTKGKIPDRNTTHHTLNNPVDKDIPLAILVNRRSASATEIVAGAIQDYDRGVVIGQRTFGKGLVQNVVPLSYNTQLKVTVAKYYIPSGRSIQAIDYAQRREDGSVEKIPDAHKSEFTTQNGRIVYDGGGIEPDVALDPLIPAHVTRELITGFHIFDFATRFYRTHDEIAGPEEFSVSQEMYDDFVQFLEERDFDYSTDSEKLLKELKGISREEKYFEAIESLYIEMKDQIKQNKAADLITFRPEIEWFLREEIVARYFYQKGRVLSNLEHDDEVREAVRLLNDKEKYASILIPGEDQ